MSFLNLDTLHENQLQAAGELNPNAPQTRFHFASGETVVVPTSLLLRDAVQPAASGPAQSAAAMSSPAQNVSAASATSAASAASDSEVISLVQEELEIHKRVVETERVRLTRGVEEFTQHVAVPLTAVNWEIEHVLVGEVVAEHPEPRQAGETMIFPLVEERLVLRRELFLREEVHVRRVSTTNEQTADVTLKRDTLTEERTPLHGN